MRNGMKNFKEYHQISEWRDYVNTYMSNAKKHDTDTEVNMLTRHGVIIAVWQKHGYGYIEECRTADRLSKQIAA